MVELGRERYKTNYYNKQSIRRNKVFRVYIVRKINIFYYISFSKGCRDDTPLFLSTFTPTKTYSRIKTLWQLKRTKGF